MDSPLLTDLLLHCSRAHAFESSSQNSPSREFLEGTTFQTSPAALLQDCNKATGPKVTGWVWVLQLVWGVRVNRVNGLNGVVRVVGVDGMVEVVEVDGAVGVVGGGWAG